ncbi:MAG: hypothetical protein FWC79_02170 [Oscillospiraceae bacterium]|nr:hypothetical protein [Oscillospiraceae bacterium]
MIFDVLGWIGMILVLVAYALISTNKIKNGKLYHALNLLGGICMGIGLFTRGVWFSFTLQIVWSLVAVIAIIKILNKKGEKENGAKH